MRAFSSSSASTARILIIDYCASCGYAPWAADVATAVARAAPTWTVHPRPVPTAATFDVRVEGGPTLWSKLETGQPADRAGVAAVAEVVVSELEKRR